MPAPTAAQMKGQAIGMYGQPLGPDALDYLTALFDKISAAWDKWQKSMTFGKLLVSGGGVGAWSGVGSGGIMTGSPFVMEPFAFKGNSPQQMKFTGALGDALKAKFTPFPTTFKFSGVQYVGTSGASPTSGGPVNANNAPTALAMAGKGIAPSGIADLWANVLLPPEFDLKNPAAKSEQLIKAVSTAIEQSFQNVWLVSTMINGNTLMATGAPGGVVAGFPTESNGKLV